MAQRHRGDHPGSWHHVMNRGIARRTGFETRHDIRAFLAAVACEVRRGDIQVHAYSILATHFHLLVYSPRGRVPHAMRRLLNRYVRRFNRLRRRDGSLFRGRYRSRPVRTSRYRMAVLRYIDHNPVAAQVAGAAENYFYGSARALALGSTPLCPPETVLQELASAADASGLAQVQDPAGYRKPAVALLQAGLLRDVAGLSYAQVTSRIGHSIPYWQRMYEAHRRVMRSNEEYREVIARITAASLRACHGNR